MVTVCKWVVYVLCISVLVSCGTTNTTSTKEYFYPSGELKVREQYKNGDLARTTWYNPSGDIVAETSWDNGTGIGLYLYDNGEVSSVVSYSEGVAQGVTIQLSADGHTKAIEFYGRDGLLLSKRQPPPQDLSPKPVDP